MTEQDLPQETRQGNRLIYKWEQYNLTITVDRIINSHRGLSAEVTFDHLHKGLLHAADMTLMSSSSRETYIRALKARVPDLPFDWPMIVVAVAIMVKRAAGAGKIERINLMHHLATAQTKWCCYPYLVHNAINVIYGPPGVLKSYLATAIQIAILTGDQRILGIKPGCKHNALYLDWEDDQETHAERLRRLLTPYPNIELIDFPYTKCFLPLSKLTYELVDFVRAARIELLILDSTIYLADGNPNDDETVRVVKEGLDQLPGTKLLLAHDTKEKGKGIRGSLIWKAMARNVWQIKAHSEAGQSELHIGLYHDKGNKSRKLPSQGFKVLFDDEGDTTMFQPEQPGRIPELAGEMSSREHIQQILTQPMNVDAITEVTGISRATVYKTLERGEGSIFINFGGKWAKLASGQR